jgi:hypothetical protein
MDPIQVGEDKDEQRPPPKGLQAEKRTFNKLGSMGPRTPLSTLHQSISLPGHGGC